MIGNRFSTDDTSGVEDVGMDIVFINPTALNDAVSGGRTYFTMGAGGAVEQAPATVLSETRGAIDHEAVERMRGR
jgi:hypothetical protein